MEIHARTILPLLAVMLIPTIDIIDYIPDNKDNWNPYGMLLILVRYASSMKLSLLALNSYEVMSILLI